MLHLPMKTSFFSVLGNLLFRPRLSVDLCAGLNNDTCAKGPGSSHSLLSLEPPEAITCFSAKNRVDALRQTVTEVN